jgi:hypothetical protein
MQEFKSSEIKEKKRIRDDQENDGHLKQEQSSILYEDAFLKIPRNSKLAQIKTSFETHT